MFQAGGGTAPYSWSISSGNLPEGLNLNPTTGLISGSPATGGIFNFTVRVSDKNARFSDQDFSLGIVTPYQAFQIQYFGCYNCQEANESADPDGDGQNNRAEFLAGTNPTNSISRLRITAAARNGNDLVLTWSAVGGHAYRVQAANGDVPGGFPGNFADISADIVLPASGETVTNYVHRGAMINRPSRFYRIRLVP